jgi:hypothetical protein
LKKATLYTDNLIKSRFAFRLWRKKKSAFVPLWRDKANFSSLRTQISQQKLSIDFKKPFDFLANFPAEARGEAPSEAANSIWWCLLDDVRTFFEQNPEDFAD